MKAANCSGAIGIGSIASAERRSRSAGEASDLLISALSFFVMSAGSFAGPTMPYHCTLSKPGKPSSSKVGRSGCSGWRLRPVMAIGLILPDADVRQRGGESGHQHVDLAADDVGERRPDAAVVRVDRPFQPGRAAELLEREVIEQADAAGAPVQLVRVLLRVLDEALEVGDRHRGVHHQQVRRAAHHRDRREVAYGVIGHLAHGGIGAVRADVADHQRVAVGRRAGGVHRGDRAAARRPSSRR